MAGVSFKGDFAKLKSIGNRLKEFIGRGPYTELSHALAGEALYRVRQGFRKETDPYGEAWAPIKRKGRILRDTGRLANSWARLRANRSGFAIGTPVQYASVHQEGADYTRKARVAFRGRSGRFANSARARSKASTRKRGAANVALLRGGNVSIPARRMVPTEALGLGTWTAPLERITKRLIGRRLRGKR